MGVENDANIEGIFQHRLNQFCESQSLDCDESEFTTFHDELINKLDAAEANDADDSPLESGYDLPYRLD